MKLSGTSDSGVTTQTPFRTEGELAVRCNCGWHMSSRRQSTATAAAKRHVDMYPSHEVTTMRIQCKLTFRRSR